jgi:putative transposase
MHVHLVFVAKYRRDAFTKAMLETIHEVFKPVCLDFEAELIAFDAEHDHVYLLVNYPPKVAISSLVNRLKGASGRILRTKHPEIKSKLWGNALWSPSDFAASCAGAPIGIIKQYIQQQQTPH